MKLSDKLSNQLQYLGFEELAKKARELEENPLSQFTRGELLGEIDKRMWVGE